MSSPTSDRVDRPRKGFSRWPLAVAFFLAGSACAAPFDWQVQENYRWAALTVPAGKTGFTLLKRDETGIDFLNESPEEESLNGGGVALGDFDNDGLCDIYFTALHGRHRLYKNLGRWKFQDVTDGSGVECDAQFGKGACFVDLNGDRNLDLVVTAMVAVSARAGGLRSFLGDGKGKFRETSEEAGLACNFGSHTIAAADIDGNGTLDLYVSNAGATDRQEQKRGYYETLKGQQIFSWVRYNAAGRVVERVDFPIVAGRLTVPAALQDRFFVGSDGEIKELGPPDLLLIGDGRGKFAPASWTDGRFLDEDGTPLKKPPLDFGLSATFRDLNGDGAPDLYVCNDCRSGKLRRGRGQRLVMAAYLS